MSKGVFQVSEKMDGYGRSWGRDHPIEDAIVIAAEPVRTDDWLLIHRRDRRANAIA